MRAIRKNSKGKILISAISVILFLIFTFLNISSFYVTDEDVVKFQTVYFIVTIVCSLLAFCLGSVKFRMIRKRKLTKILGITSYILALIGAMVISILFSGGFWADTYLFFVNTAFYACVTAVTLIISTNLRVSVIAALVASYVFNGISFIVYCFRGWSLTPTDLAAWRTAMNVAAQYNFKLGYEIFASTALLALLVLLVHKFPYELNYHFKGNKLAVRCVGAGILAAAVLFIGTTNQDNYNISVYNQHKANMNYGSAYSFYVNARRIGLEGSRNYDSEKLDQLLQSYEQTIPEPENMPNVLVVMNESFSDLKVVGDFETDVDYMPFVKSLEENAIKGETLVSPFGGYTCNSEYEFLTGMSTGLFKAQQSPYMQMIFDYMPYSLPQHMKQLGYQTLAIHPYTGDGWNRNIVYNYMGFDDYISVEDFDILNPNPEYIRSYITDRSNYDAVLKYLEDKDDNERAFVYNITMQNHGGYTDKNFESEVHLLNMSRNYPKTEQYLTLIKHADEDMKYLLERLSQFDEPTVVVMFGDHLPSVETTFFKELYGTKSLDDLGTEELYKRYITPFFIWANFDIEEKQGVKTSPCFLSNMLMEVAGIPKSRIQLYLDDLQTEIMQINPMCYFDTNGVLHEHSDSARIEEYFDVQYSLLSGSAISYDFYNFKNTIRLPGGSLLKPRGIVR